MKTAFKTIGGILLGLMIIGSIVRGIGKSTSKNMLNNSLEEAIEIANSSCPIEIGGGAGYVRAIKLEDNNVTYYIHFNEGNNNLIPTEQNRETIKEFFVMTLLCMNGQEYGQGDFFVSKLIDEGCGLRIVYTDSSGKNIESVTSVDELKSMKDKFHQNPHEALWQVLEMEIEAERASLPQKIEEGMFITNYSLEGENIVIIIKVDEYLYSINEFRNNREIIKNAMLEEAANDLESKSLLDLCKVSHTGLDYHVVGNRSHNSVDIIISSDEIRRFDTTPSSLNIH